MKAYIIIFSLLLFGSSCKNLHYNRVATDQNRSLRNTKLLLNTCATAFPSPNPGPVKTDTVTVIDTALNNSQEQTIKELSEYILATSLLSGCVPVDTGAIAAMIRRGIKPTYVNTITTVTDSIPFIPREITYKLAAFELSTREDAKTIDKQGNEIDALTKAKKRLLYILEIGIGILLVTVAGIYYFSRRKKA